MNTFKPTILLFGFLLFAVACQTNYPKDTVPQPGNQYSRSFRIEADSGGYTLHLFSPWMNEESEHYTYFLKRNTKINKITNLANQTIAIPIQRVAVMSTTHLAFIEAIESSESVVAVSDTRYVNSLKYLNRINQGEIANIGYETSLDFETLLSVRPDVCFMYGLSSSATQTAERLISLGIPVVFVSEFNEQKPLGKLEWLRFIACFYDKFSFADSLFQFRVKSYENALKLTKGIELRPTVLVGLPWKDVWNVPGNYTVTAEFIRDAGGEYIFQSLNQKINYNLSIEEVYSVAANAQFWINIGIATAKSDIVSTDYRLNLFRAYQDGRLFNNNKRINSFGGNDYMESGVLFPDSILLDLISILHPEKLPNYQTRYYQRLQ
ncbi:MAG TPA: ABC transporter substrate-binding protein [Salinivirgaceae bacterium]|nr:ABC transporter substrate-binding protein [Salinivirgaceae bacterium]